MKIKILYIFDLDLRSATASMIPDAQTQTKGPKGCKKRKKEKKISYVIKAIGKKRKKKYFILAAVRFWTSNSKRKDLKK